MGTRPEIIRLSRTIALLDRTTHHILVHTGQNYDYSLNKIFFEELEIREPDRFLNIDTSSLGRALGDILIKTEEAILLEQPDAVLILGDTNSSISAIIAKRMRIPVYHMEAGNRCFDDNVPEETNRRLVDHVADFNLVYTEHARRNLISEGIHPRRILLTGSPMREVLNYYLPAIKRSDILARLGLSTGGYIVVSAHREETVDSPVRLQYLLDCLAAVRDRWHVPIIVSTHPRTQKRLAELDTFSKIDGVLFSPPFGFYDYNRLQLDSMCVLSDSGTISEESAILGFPAVTLRDSIERPEALDSGSIIMTGLDSDDVLNAVSLITSDSGRLLSSPPIEYMVDNSSSRTVRFILSTARRHHQWAGIRT